MSIIHTSRLAKSILDDPDEADDAAQDTFIAVNRPLQEFRGKAHIKTWLSSITIIEPSMMEGYNQEQALVGNVMIENNELAYRSTSMQRCTSNFASYPDADQFLTHQPVWVFTGRFDDGRQFQLQVQALPDAYLY